MSSSRRLALTVAFLTWFCGMILSTPRVAWAAATISEDASEATVSRGEPPQDVAEDSIALRLLAPSMELKGTHATVVVQAFRPHDQTPVTHLPVQLDVHADEGRDDGDGPSRRLGSYIVVTDARGTASLRFPIPRFPLKTLDESPDTEITVTATGQGTESSVEIELWALKTLHGAQISTDRRVYEPGQTVHLWGLWRDDLRLPQDELSVRLTIFDPEHQESVHLEGLTSTMGIAAWDWPISPSALPGTYRIQARSRSELDGFELDARSQFEVLPAPPDVRLEVRPRQSVVFPSDHPEIEVWARDADGEPLVGAPVHVVEMVIIGESEADRGARPLYPSSRADALGQATFAFGAFQETDSASPPPIRKHGGRTDAEGRLTITLTDLDIAFDKVDDVWDNDDDLVFEARLTDPGTGRSFASSFELRLSRHAVYLQAEGSVGDRGLPDDVYLFAQHADGTPATCWVEVRRPDFPEAHRVVGRVQTNDLGAAALEELSLDPLNRYELVALAEGLEDQPIGTAEISLARQQGMRLLTERPLLQVGEDIHMELHIAHPRPHLQAFLWNAEGELLGHRDHLPVAASQSLTFPYRDTYQGVLTVQVVDLLAATRPMDSQPSTARAVVYPGQARPELAISVLPLPANQMARLNLQSEGTRGPAVAALAVIQRSAASHGRPQGLEVQPSLPGDVYTGWESYDPQDLHLGGWNLQRVLDLPEETRYSDAAQVVARGLLGDGYFRPQASATSFPIDRQETAPDIHQRLAIPGTSGQLIGRVAHLDGKPIPRARITVVNGAESWEAVSDAEGLYQLSLPTGSYRVEVQSEGWPIIRYEEFWIPPEHDAYLPTLFWPDLAEPIVIGVGSPDQYITEATSTPPLGTMLRRSGTIAADTAPEVLFWLPEEPLDTNGQLTVDIPLPLNGTRWHIAALLSDGTGNLTPAQIEWVFESKK